MVPRPSSHGSFSTFLGVRPGRCWGRASDSFLTLQLHRVSPSRGCRRRVLVEVHIAIAGVLGSGFNFELKIIL